MKNILNRLSILNKLNLVIAISILGLIAITGYLARNHYVQTVEDRQELVRQEVVSATGVLKWAHQLETSGKVSREQAQEMAKTAIGAMRYGANDYFWINDLNGVTVMHPIKPELVGKDGSTVKDPNGFQVMNEAARLVRQSGAGYLHYQWPRPGKDQPVEKVSYVQGFEPWGWVIASGLYVDDLRDAFIQNAQRLSVVVAAVALLVGWIGVVVSRTIVRGIDKAVRVINEMATGDLSVNIQIKGNDEVTHLLSAMSSMQEHLSSVVMSVRQGSEAVAAASTQIALGNGDLASRTEQQASALEETTSNMEELLSTVKQNAASAKQANQLAASASTVATQGGEVVAQVVETMKGINESSSKISEIIAVIDSIAFQTNILALNAAVEAARAGEQGRGFAVVASEVRSLAGRSAEAAREIKSLINASVERVEKGTDLVDKAGMTMTETVAGIRRVTDIMGEINTASDEQAAGMLLVGEAVQNMDQTTQQNAALVEEMAAAASSLKSQAQDLVQVVATFKLNDRLVSSL
jgi:methyl-accepting chemotaxis protein